jgi:hypothetical protein
MILGSDYVQSTSIINLHGMTVPVFFVFHIEVLVQQIWTDYTVCGLCRGIIQNSATVIPCIIFVYDLMNTEIGNTWGLVWISHDFLVAQL